MDTPTLVNTAQIELGEIASDSLRASPLTVRAVLWWWDPDAEKWKFMVASDEYSLRGPKFAYNSIQKTFHKEGLDLSITDVWAVEPEHPVVTALQRMMNSGSTHIRFTNCSINGVHFADVYVYWIGKRKATVRKRRKK